MWADDEFWYPLFVAGQHFVGLFGFTETTTMQWKHLRVVGSSDDLATDASELLPGPQ
jgi:hypothetical protein